MKSSGLGAITLVPLVMAALSLLSMMGMFQINKIVQQDLYRYGKPYWDISVFVFIVGWFNIILAVAFLLYVVTYERRETKQFAAGVKKEIVNIEKEQELEPIMSSETEQKDMKPKAEEKKEEPPIIIGLTEEELQTSN